MSKKFSLPKKSATEATSRRSYFDPIDGEEFYSDGDEGAPYIVSGRVQTHLEGGWTINAWDDRTYSLSNERGYEKEITLRSCFDRRGNIDIAEAIGELYGKIMNDSEYDGGNGAGTATESSSRRTSRAKKLATEELSFEGADLVSELPAPAAGTPGAAFPIPTTNFREDFTKQAKELKEKIGLGPTPERVEKPKNDLTLDKNGYLKGDIETVKEGKKSESIDLTEKAKAVNEGVKRPVFKRKSSTQPAEPLATEPSKSEPVKDERESEDKQPTEAVACENILDEDYPYGPIRLYDGSEITVYLKGLSEKQIIGIEDGIDDFIMAGGGQESFYVKEEYVSSIEYWNVVSKKTRSISYEQYKSLILSDGKLANTSSTESANDATESSKGAFEAKFPAFNKREQDFIASGNPSSVRAAMADGSLSKVRGRQILFTMGAAAEEGIEIPKAADTGTPIEQPTPNPELVKKPTAEERRKEDNNFNSNLEADIDTQVGDAYSCNVVYTSRKPYEGQVTRLDKDTAYKVKGTFESLGLKTRVIAAKEQYSVLFTEEQPIDTTTWYALVLNKNNSGKVSQLTLTVSAGATETEVRNYLIGIYGESGVLQVSTTKFA